MIGKFIQPEILELIEKRDLGTLREVILDLHPPELAELLSEIDASDQAVVFRLLPRAFAADIFEYLDLDVQQSLLKALGREQVTAILNEMSPDDRTALFEELPGPVVKQLMELLTPTERAIAAKLLGYPEESVGRLMTPDYIAVRADWTVADVLDYIRRHGHDSESLNMVYVTDELGRLIDDIRIREFLLAPLDRLVRELMNERFIRLVATDDREKAVELIREYDRTALPVTDSEGYLVGIVTVDDVLDVAEETATEDIQKFGGVEALDYPYIKTPLFALIRKRAGWLILLFLGEMLTASAMGYFEHEIARAVVLALFVPLIISSGGNTGSQAATLIIRAMALDEIALRDWWYVMRREVLTGLLLGATLGIFGFLRIAVWSAFSPIYGPHWLLIAFTVMFSLIGVVLWGTLSGSMLPFVLRRFGFDPAASSAPFVATLVDVTGLVIYFSIGSFILRGTLL